MSTIINDAGATDEYISLTGLTNGENVYIEITLGSNAMSFGTSDWSYFIVDNTNIYGQRIHDVTNYLYIYSLSFQVDAGTVYSPNESPVSLNTINPLLTNGAVVKILNLTAGAGAFHLFGHTDPALGMTADISQIDIKKTSDDSVIATFDLSTPAQQYVNNGVTLDLVNLDVADTQPPGFSSNPAVTATTGSGHTISTTIDEDGDIYAVRLASGAAAPTAAQVKAGNDSTNSPAPEAKNQLSASASTNYDLVFSTGSASTEYDYYIVAEDTSGNLQTIAAANKVTATTSSGTMSTRINNGATDEYILVSGLTPSADVYFEITLGSNGLSFGGEEWSWLIRDPGDTFGPRIHDVTGFLYFYAASFQIDSGTIYTNADNPKSLSTINPLLVSGAVVKVLDYIVPSQGTVHLFGDSEGTRGIDVDVSQIVIKNTSNDSVVATFDLSTPSQQYTNSGITLDLINTQIADTQPPVFSSNPTVTATTGSGHTISTTIDEDGKIYAVRLASGAAAPTASQVKAGNDSTDSPAPEAKSELTALSDTNYDLVFNTGSATTEYDYYIVAEDTSANLQTVAAENKVTATTSSGTFTVTGGAVEPNTLFNFTYDGISSVASPITIGPDSQGNTIDVSITDSGNGVGFGTFPALPSSGTASYILFENGLDVTVSDV